MMPEVEMEMKKSCRNCPHVLPTYGMMVGIHRIGIVMEYADGGSLASLIASKGDSLSWTDCLGLARGAARGLNYLHEIEMVHRDVKSQIFLICNGLVKLQILGNLLY